MAKGQTLELEAAEPCEVDGSDVLLAVLIRNLVDNAVRHTAEGSVTVFTRRLNGSVQVGVRDTGSGIPPEHLPRIFERFYRVDAARSRETGGTGLGLAIVKHVSNNHGGEVSVWSQEGRGSTFTMTLPAAPDRLAVHDHGGDPVRATSEERQLHDAHPDR